ncbi:hypothetical protein SAMN05878282_102574 [Aquipseudomonas alcaligenes]|uniref:Uncharacterized protein n=1 Tax=Aquipseudomonas alcaligenes TaxID=43263 RepID=A0A1N6QPA4_AQUAC|nr:hypothetical protein SAMN05878282_102574 [Pseudomonas alcaligenes]
MAVIATVPLLTSSALVGGAKPPHVSASEAPNLFPHRLIVRFRPAGRLTFFACAKKVSKETHPGIRASLRSTPLLPVPLRGPSRRDVPVPSFLARHPCLASPCTTPPLGLLTGSLRACRFRVSGLSALSVCLAVGRVQPAQPPHAGFTRPTRSYPGSAPAGRRASPEGFPRKAWKPSTNSNATTTLPILHHRLGPGSGPVRRLSGIVEPGVERHGCRERRDGPGMALRDVPLEQRWNEGTPPQAGPDVGCAFSLVTFSLRKQIESNSP